MFDFWRRTWILICRNCGASGRLRLIKSMYTAWGYVLWTRAGVLGGVVEVGDLGGLRLILPSLVGRIAHRVDNYLLWFPGALEALYTVGSWWVSLVVLARIACDCEVNIVTPWWVDQLSELHPPPHTWHNESRIHRRRGKWVICCTIALTELKSKICISKVLGHQSLQAVLASYNRAVLMPQNYKAPHHYQLGIISRTFSIWTWSRT